jgi:two-component system NarL family response regulator
MIALAGPSRDFLMRWEHALRGLDATMVFDQADALRASMLRDRPRVVLLDLGLPGLDTPKAIARLANLSLATAIVVLGGPVSDALEIELFQAGVRGYCRNDVDPELLKRVVLAVTLGELWIRRSLVPRLLDALGLKFPAVAAMERRAVTGRLVSLTEREHQIAALVGSGGTNKQIARQLAITERTVKAHLTEVFRKLGITDRLKLALLLAGGQGNA